MSTPKYIRYEEVAKHTTEDSLWFVHNRRVFDVTKFVDEHPGGLDTLLGVAGKDGTSDFDVVGHSDEAKKDLERFYIGDIHPDDREAVPAASKPAQNSYFGFAVVLVLVAICAFFIFKS